MIKRYRVRIAHRDGNQINLAAGWGLIHHRPFAKFRVTKYSTTFWFTQSEYNEYNEILKSSALWG